MTADPYNVPTGSDLKRWRISMDATTHDVAVRADVHDRTVRSVENGNGNISSLRAVLEALREIEADRS